VGVGEDEKCVAGDFFNLPVCKRHN